MRLVLHIGSEKTGTTSFQLWAHENWDALAGEGVWYARALDPPNHRPISIIGRTAEEREDGFAAFGLETAGDHASFVERHMAALAEDVAAAKAAGARVYLISSEHCQSRLTSAAMVSRLAGYVLPLFEQVEIVCFLRPQADLAQSLASTMARAAQYVSPKFLAEVVPGDPYYDYGALLARWADVFGRDAVIPVPFRRNPSAVEWFRKRLWIDAETLTEERRVNGPLDYRAVALLNLLADTGAAGGGQPFPPLMRQVNPDLLPCEQRLSISRADAEAIQLRFAKVNAQVVADWPSLRAGDLDPELGRYPEVGTLDLVEQADVGLMLAHVLGRLNAELWLAWARIAGMECDWCAAHGLSGEARRHFEAGSYQLAQAEGYEPLAAQVTPVRDAFENRRMMLEEIKAKAVS